MPTPVTDPNLLQQLEGGGSSSSSSTGPRPVTDPDLLKQLEGDDGGFFGKVGRFARNVYENPPPTVAGIRDVIKAAPQAATELTYGADPEAARQAAGTMLQAATLGPSPAPGLRAGEGVLARPLTQAARERPLVPAAPPPPSAAAPAIEAGSRLGVDIPRFMATDSKVAPGVAGSIKNVPWAGQPITEAVETLGTQPGAARDRLVPFARTPEMAGQSAAEGVGNWMTAGSRGPVSSRYKVVDDLIDPSVRRPLGNTAQMVAEIQAGRAQSRIPGTSAAVDRVLPAIQDPAGMDYAGAKGLRTWLGETTPQELVAQGINPIEAKRLYGALTKDLTAIVGEAGGPQALQAWQEANALARLTKLQQRELGKLIGTRGDVPAEGVFNKLVGYAGTGRGADLRRLRLAREAMGPQAWEEVGGSIISRLGQAPEGAFSPDRFVTAYAKLAPDARNLLFTQQQRAALADLNAVAVQVKDKITKYANPSGTGRAVFGGGVLTGALADPVSLIGGMVGGRMLANALSKPAVVHAAAAVTRRAALGNPFATRKALDRLHAVVGREGLLLPQSPQQPPQTPQRAGPVEYTYAPGEIEANQAASFNGAQGYPDFRWVNPAGVAAFLASGPMSQNIEDRRGEHTDAEAAKYRRMLRVPD